MGYLVMLESAVSSTRSMKMDTYGPGRVANNADSENVSVPDLQMEKCNFDASR